MFKKKFAAALSCFAIAGTLILPNGNVNAAGISGWKSNGVSWNHYSNGVKSIGWLKDGQNWYYLNSNGDMAQGWLLDGSNWYYLNNNGSMATGWQLIKSKWYYFYNSGAMASNTTVDGWTAESDGTFHKVLKIGETAVIKDVNFGTYELTVNSVELTNDRNKYVNTAPAEVYKLTYTYKLLSKGTSNVMGLYIYGFDTLPNSENAPYSYPNNITKAPKELLNVGDTCTAETFIAVNKSTTKLDLIKYFFVEKGSDYVKLNISTK
ncbi:MAG: hypothetical protein ACM3X7_14640 [Solirubrobacterales bacterium]